MMKYCMTRESWHCGIEVWWVALVQVMNFQLRVVEEVSVRNGHRFIIYMMALYEFMSAASHISEYDCKIGERKLAGCTLLITA